MPAHWLFPAVVGSIITLIVLLICCYSYLEGGEKDRLRDKRTYIIGVTLCFLITVLLTGAVFYYDYTQTWTTSQTTRERVEEKFKACTEHCLKKCVPPKE
jgi:hypothetical protein